MVELVLIRHGETDYNRDKKYFGWTDISMNKYGREQIKVIKSHLINEEFDAVYCSDLKRCVETADIIGFDKESMIITNDLRELNFGVMEGLVFGEVKEKYPEMVDEIMQNRGHFKIPEGESVDEFINRITGVVEEIINKHEGKVAVVTHGGVIQGLLAHYLAGSPEAFWRFKVENGTVTRLCKGDYDFFLTGLNHR